MAYAFGLKRWGNYLASPIYNPNTLKAYFQFSVDTTTDHSGNGLTLTQANTVSRPNNKWGGAADFGNSDGHTNLLYRSGTDSMGIAVGTGNQYTIAFLFNSNAVPSTGVGRVIDFGGGSSYVTLQYRNNGGTIQWDTASGSGTAITKVWTMPIGVWYRVVFTMDSSNNGRLYFNAIPEPSLATNGGSASGSNCGIGNANNSPGSNSNGVPAKFAELVLDQRYWTPQMVLQDYRWTMFGKKNNPVFSAVKKLAGAATDVTVSPSVKTATFSTQSPTVTGNATVSPSALSATFTKPAMTVTTAVAVAPNALTATFTLPTPNIITPDAQVLVGAPVSATFSVQTPTIIAIIADVTVNAGVQSATFAVQSATVTAEKNAVVSPSTLSATFSTFSPTVTTTRSVDVLPQAVVATFTLIDPRRSGGLWRPTARHEGVWTPQARVSG